MTICQTAPHWPNAEALFPLYLVFKVPWCSLGLSLQPTSRPAAVAFALGFIFSSGAGTERSITIQWQTPEAFIFLFVTYKRILRKIRSYVETLWGQRHHTWGMCDVFAGITQTCGRFITYTFLRLCGAEILPSYGSVDLDTTCTGRRHTLPEVSYAPLSSQPSPLPNAPYRAGWPETDLPYMGKATLRIPMPMVAPRDARRKFILYRLYIVGL